MDTLAAPVTISGIRRLNGTESNFVVTATILMISSGGASRWENSNVTVSAGGAFMLFSGTLELISSVLTIQASTFEAIDSAFDFRDSRLVVDGPQSSVFMSGVSSSNISNLHVVSGASIIVADGTVLEIVNITSDFSAVFQASSNSTLTIQSLEMTSPFIYLTDTLLRVNVRLVLKSPSSVYLLSLSPGYIDLPKLHYIGL
jgi:membrane-associated HD superfamily phosphohydrolase